MGYFFIICKSVFLKMVNKVFEIEDDFSFIFVGGVIIFICLNIFKVELVVNF